MENNIEERVARIQENFTYTKIGIQSEEKVCEKSNCEIWHCGAGTSSSYAFDICIMPMGIAICGDIGELTFNVYNRGIDFLAGRDIGYYIHSKLSHNCRERQFSEEKFYSHVVDWILSSFEDKSFIDDFIYEEFEKLQQDGNFADFFEKCRRMYFDSDTSSDEHDYLSDLDDFVEAVKEVCDSRAAHELLNQTDFLSFDDSWEFDFTEMNDGLWFKLNMINHAAKQIMNIKTGETK